MKHYFIINPAAGPKDSSAILKQHIEKLFENKTDTYEIYITKSAGESYKIANEASNNLTEETIFYACGGDGTCFDVINGKGVCINFSDMLKNLIWMGKTIL